MEFFASILVPRPKGRHFGPTHSEEFVLRAAAAFTAIISLGVRLACDPGADLVSREFVKFIG